jgi:hypothetical protein
VLSRDWSSTTMISTLTSRWAMALTIARSSVAAAL